VRRTSARKTATSSEHVPIRPEEEFNSHCSSVATNVATPPALDEKERIAATNLLKFECGKDDRRRWRTNGSVSLLGHLITNSLLFESRKMLHVATPVATTMRSRRQLRHRVNEIGIEPMCNER
jgi:hypothetical protein